MSTLLAYTVESPVTPDLAEARAAELLDIIVDVHLTYRNGLYELRRSGEYTIEDQKGRMSLFIWFSRAFPRWLANVHAKCPVLEVRQHLARNIFDEEVFDDELGDYHVGRQIKEAAMLGIPDEVMNDPSRQSPTILACLNAWDNITRTRSWQEGLSALACLELSNTKVMRERLNLPSQTRVFQGQANPDVGRTAAHHEKKDEEHGLGELIDLCRWVDNDSLWEDVKRTVRESTMIWACFMHAMYRKVRLGETM